MADKAEVQMRLTKPDEPAPPSIYIDPSKMEWKKDHLDGIWSKEIYAAPDGGLTIALHKFEPGGKCPLHEHTDFEMSMVLEGTFDDRDGEGRPGTIILRPAGSTHRAFSPEGGVVLSIYRNPTVISPQKGGDPYAVGVVRTD